MLHKPDSSDICSHHLIRQRATQGLALVIFVIMGSCVTPASSQSRQRWRHKLTELVWVAYSPPTSNPVKGIEANSAEISKDLAILRKHGFNGLVTYGSSGILGRELRILARRQGFKGIIMGVWDPANQNELASARAAAQDSIVVGFCVGNEGLDERYQFGLLTKTIRGLRNETGKPTTTSEIIEKYNDAKLLELGDWVFPNAHPYFHGKTDPDAAMQWTKDAYDALRARTHRFVMFKEVGLPTTGDSAGRLSEQDQGRYYRRLAQTDVRFVYFEAFDQPWKTQLPVEPHWGLFHADHTPKPGALDLKELKRKRSKTRLRLTGKTSSMIRN